jgi:D-hexose-6-phosphate mutarotase
MPPPDLETLNESFAITDHIAFVSGAGGLPFAQIRNAFATATVSLHGGQVLAFQPHGHGPVLWVSAQSLYQPGKAIRGGIPVCWPWFGPHPSDPAKPAHGFARTSLWSVLSAAALADGATQIRLRLADGDTSLALWPHAFDLRLVVTVGAELKVELIARNPGSAPYTYSGALHSYFDVSDIAAISIRGLDGCPYIDQVDGDQRKLQHGPITIASETDRVYLNTTETCAIEDPGLDRRITIAKAGSHSTVVWNPWVEKARRLADFGDEEYHSMVCVETANADGDSVTVAPGGEQRLTAIIGVEHNELFS